MKIVMLCDFYCESLSYQENILAKYYVKNGHEVTVITSVFDSVFDYVADKYNPRLSKRVYFADQVKIVKLPYRINFLSRVRKFSSLLGILRDELPDLIFVHDVMLNFPDVIAYVRSHVHVRIIMDYHADYSNSGKNMLSLKVLHGIIRKRVLDSARPYLQRIFPVTPASAKFLHEVYGVPLSEMELLPLGADLDTGRDVHAEGRGHILRSDYCISPRSFVIFTGGKLTPAKCTELMIDAFFQLKCQDAWLFIVGDCAEVDSEYMKYLRKIAADCSRIVFTGWLDSRKILEYLDMANIAVFPASQSILWQQAIGMGKPLVIGDSIAKLNGKQDVSYLNTYDNIVIADEAHPNASEIASIINALIEDPDRLEHMAIGARRVASELLDWNSIVNRTLEFN